MNRNYPWLMIGFFMILASCRALPVDQKNSQLMPPTLIAGQSQPPASPASVTQGDEVSAKAQFWRLQSDASHVRILVYRGGRLARFGHNHVVEVTGLTGEIVLSVPNKIGQGGAYRFDLQFLAKDLQVDRPEARKRQGGDFAKPLSESAIVGTRDNMLSEAVLDAVRFPAVRLKAVGRQYQIGRNTIPVMISLHGAERTLEVPVQLMISNDRLLATGQLRIKQTNFGITPFSVMFGALKVKDALDIEFELVARRR